LPRGDEALLDARKDGHRLPGMRRMVDIARYVNGVGGDVEYVGCPHCGEVVYRRHLVKQTDVDIINEVREAKAKAAG